MTSIRHIQTFSHFGGLICGRGGHKIKGLRQKFSLSRVFLDRGEEGTSTLILKGSPTKVEEAEKWITQKYPSAFLNPKKILPMDDAREIFLKRRLQRKLNQTSTTFTPIIPHTDFPKKEKAPSPPRTFVWEKYLC
jgi:hypothetical protein